MTISNQNLALLQLSTHKHPKYCNGEAFILIKVRRLPDSVSMYCYLESLQTLLTSKGFKCHSLSVWGCYIQVSPCSIERFKAVVPAEFM